MNIFFIYINCLVEFIPVMDEDFQSCMPDKKYHRVDLENFKLVTGKDRVYANGTVKFLKDIQSPWKVKIMLCYDVESFKVIIDSTNVYLKL